MDKRKAAVEELTKIKRQLSDLSTMNENMKGLMAEKESSDKTSSQLFTLLKYMIDENKRTTMLLGSISEMLARVESVVSEPIGTEEETEVKASKNAVKELPVSDVDARILQAIQLSPNSMACADDIRKRMNYNGRNAASARLNRLYKMGAIERLQLGHKVYYKYDAGKATNLLIVSPPQ
ncbi:hypothetical protein M1329_01195 [Candidatus Marsarchaeota archaeon]|jgi:hypothetical protein|nr:hypothetical protein [Candidatus Marsarchaeota archaeon]MCL5099714.1 hypothetical protein [Candidatus Marsarchaeota archaeon]